MADLNTLLRPDLPAVGAPPNLLAPAPSWADAASNTAQNVGDYVAQQRAQSVAMGLLDPKTGLPTAAGVVNAGQQYGNALLMGTTAPGLARPNLLGPEALTSAAEAAPGANLRVSTTVPTAVGQAVDPHTTSDLGIGRTAMELNPETFKRNMDTVRDYSHINTDGMNDSQVADAFTQHLHDNIVGLWDRIPADIRERSTQWYSGANKLAGELADEHGISQEQAAAVIANLSPQKDWFQNYNLATRVLDTQRSLGDTKATPEMQDAMQAMVDARKQPAQRATLQKVKDAIGDKTFGELDDPAQQALFTKVHDEVHNADRSYPTISPEGELGPVQTNKDGVTPTGVSWGSLNEIASAYQALKAQDLEGISKSLGGNHKVRSFYNNIISPDAPMGDVTNDTHAINVAHMLPMGGSHPIVDVGLGTGGAATNISGAKGLYGLYADAYRRAADTISNAADAARSYLPREVQSATWEAVRGLFDNAAMKKTDKTTGDFTHPVGKAAAALWDQARRGEITPDQARNGVIDAAGGINPPVWYTPP